MRGADRRGRRHHRRPDHRHRRRGHRRRADDLDRPWRDGYATGDDGRRYGRDERDGHEHDQHGGRDTCGSLCESTGGDTGPVGCNVFAPHCPEGEKCVWYAEGGGDAWNDTKCVSVMGDAQPGEPCTAQESAVSGVDDCVEGALCWDVDENLQGVCVELCSGSAQKPVCSDPDDFRCETAGEVVQLCLPICDLLLQDCPGDELCVVTGSGGKCVPDLSGREGQVFDPCMNYSTCDKGLTCAPANAAIECDQNAAGCCVPNCDLDLPDPMCPGVNQICYDWMFLKGKNANVGFCTIPL